MNRSTTSLTRTSDLNRIKRVETHFRALIARSTRWGRPSAAWPAAWDLEQDRIAPEAPRAGKRVYRNIDAPLGSSFYWDQPSLTAARMYSAATGQRDIAQAAERYATEFLSRGIASTGLFLWGNHYFHRPPADTLLRFVGEETPVAVDLETEKGELHELRPLTPDWTFIAGIDPAAVHREIEQALARHVYDSSTGAFNRHADAKRGHAFIEAGGVLCESAAWLANETRNESARASAHRMAHYSFSNRSSVTGLVRNDPTSGRWDERVSTSEIGLWANCLLRAEAMIRDSRLLDYAAAGVAAYTAHALEPGTGNIFGMIDVATGQPVRGGETVYQPGHYVDLWHPLFPRHDYPFSLGEACCVLIQRGAGDGAMGETVRRLVALLETTLPAESRPIYAEHFGRCIRFLTRAAKTLNEPRWRSLADRVANRAIEQLAGRELFAGHTGEARYDAVDGVGLLLIALLELEHPQLECDLYR